MVANNLQIVR